MFHFTLLSCHTKLCTELTLHCFTKYYKKGKIFPKFYGLHIQRNSSTKRHIRFELHKRQQCRKSFQSGQKSFQRLRGEEAAASDAQVVCFLPQNSKIDL